MLIRRVSLDALPPFAAFVTPFSILPMMACSLSHYVDDIATISILSYVDRYGAAAAVAWRYDFFFSPPLFCSASIRFSISRRCCRCFSMMPAPLVDVVTFIDTPSLLPR